MIEIPIVKALFLIQPDIKNTNYPTTRRLLLVSIRRATLICSFSGLRGFERVDMSRIHCVIIIDGYFLAIRVIEVKIVHVLTLLARHVHCYEAWRTS